MKKKETGSEENNWNDQTKHVWEKEQKKTPYRKLWFHTEKKKLKKSRYKEWKDPRQTEE